MKLEEITDEIAQEIVAWKESMDMETRRQCPAFRLIAAAVVGVAAWVSAPCLDGGGMLNTPAQMVLQGAERFMAAAGGIVGGALSFSFAASEEIRGT